MGAVLLHFIVGTGGSLIVYFLFARFSGERSYSLPFGVIVIGLACASLAHFLSPWATPAILALYAMMSAIELRNERKARKAWEISKKS